MVYLQLMILHKNRLFLVFPALQNYGWNSAKIDFKYQTNQEIIGPPIMTGLVIRTLKTLGKTNVALEIIKMFSAKLNDMDKAALQKESGNLA